MARDRSRESVEALDDREVADRRDLVRLDALGPVVVDQAALGRLRARLARQAEHRRRRKRRPHA